MDDPTYHVVFADPPWQYSDKLQQSDTARSSADHYATMSVEAICDLGHPRGEFIGPHRVAEDALLFLCVTNPFLLDGSGAKVCQAWGFKPSQLITWVKGRICGADDTLAESTLRAGNGSLILQIGMGHITRGCTEHVIVGIRGKVKHLVLDKGVPNVVLASKGRHSAKPAELYALIERIALGPRIEMFARERRAGWDGSGIGVNDTVYVRTLSPEELAPGTTRLPDGGIVCQHGTAMDVHCCGCHSGFLFDAATCVCGREAWDHDVEWP